MSKPEPNKPNPNDPKPAETLGAMTLLERVQADRSRKGQKPLGVDDEPQFKTRQMNPTADPMQDPSAGGGKSIADTRRVQQDPNKREEGDGKGQDSAEARQFFGKSLFGDRFVDADKRAADKKEEKTKGEEGGGDEGDDKGKEKGKPQDTKPAKRAPAAPRFTRQDLQDLATTVASAAATAIAGKKESKEEDEGKGAPKLEEIGDESDQENIQVASYLAENDPDRYKALPGQFTEMAKKKSEYRKTWEGENPGKDFSWDDEEHTDFLEKVTPQFKPRDFENARIAIVADKIASKRLTEAQKRIDQLEAATVESGLKETVASAVSQEMADFVKEVSPGSKFDLTTDAGRKEAAEKDKVTGKILARYSRLLADATTELTKLYHPSRKFRIDANNELHNWIADRVDEAEATIAQSDPERTVNDRGQTFITRTEFRKLSPEQQRRYWTIGKAQAQWIVRDVCIRMAKADVDERVSELESLAKEHGWNFNRESLVTHKASKRLNPDGIDEEGDQATRRAAEEDGSIGPEADAAGRRSTENGDRQQANKKFVDQMIGQLFPREKAAG